MGQNVGFFTAPVSARATLGRPVVDRHFAVLFNAHHDDIEFTLPACIGSRQWLQMVDTADPHAAENPPTFAAHARYPLRGRSLALLTQVRSDRPSENGLRMRRITGVEDEI